MVAFLIGFGIVIFIMWGISTNEKFAKLLSRTTRIILIIIGVIVGIFGVIYIASQFSPNDLWAGLKDLIGIVIILFILLIYIRWLWNYKSPKDLEEKNISKNTGVKKVVEGGKSSTTVLRFGLVTISCLPLVAGLIVDYYLQNNESHIFSVIGGVVTFIFLAISVWLTNKIENKKSSKRHS